MRKKRPNNKHRNCKKVKRIKEGRKMLLQSGSDNKGKVTI